MKNTFFGIFLFCLFIVTSNSTSAAIYEFEASLTDSYYSYTSECPYCEPPDDYVSESGELGSVGDSVYVTLAYDTTSDGWDGRMGVNLNLGGVDYTFGRGNTGQTITTSINNGATEDTLSIVFEGGAGTIVSHMEKYRLLFSDPTGSAFESNDSVPNELNLNDFSTISIYYEYLRDADTLAPSRRVENFTAIATVPLPPVVYLFITGVISLFRLRPL